MLSSLPFPFLFRFFSSFPCYSSILFFLSLIIFLFSSLHFPHHFIPSLCSLSVFPRRLLQGLETRPAARDVMISLPSVPSQCLGLLRFLVHTGTRAVAPVQGECFCSSLLALILNLKGLMICDNLGKKVLRQGSKDRLSFFIFVILIGQRSEYHTQHGYDILSMLTI